MTKRDEAVFPDITANVLLKETIQVLVRDLSKLQLEIKGIQEVNDQEALFELLSQLFMELLEKNREDVVRLLYLIDLPQSAFEAAMKEDSPLGMAEQLASDILRREQLKAYTRIQSRR